MRDERRNKMRTVGGMETRRNILIDGNNLLHRVFHSSVSSRFKITGEISGLASGFIYFLNSWIPDMGGFSEINVFFDGYPKKRKDIFPEYKSGRNSEFSSSQNLLSMSSEINILNEALKSLGVNVYVSPDDEADDLIASFIHTHPHEINIIVSEDKDFFQLLTNPRTVLYKASLPSGRRFIDAQESSLYWKVLNGGSHPEVSPSQVRMFKSLCGDSSDNIDGIPRLRKKLAIKLCNSSSYDDILQCDLSSFSDKERELILASGEKIKRNLSLVSFFTNIDINEFKTTGSINEKNLDRLIGLNFGFAMSHFNNFLPKRISKWDMGSIYDEILCNVVL